MIRRLFLDHPASVGESYAEHATVAGSFGARMILGGVGAMLHAVFPFVCQTTGSPPGGPRPRRPGTDEERRICDLTSCKGRLTDKEA